MVQGCEVARSRSWIFLSDSGSPIGSFVLYHTPKLGIPVEMLQFHLILLLKQTILAVYHNFYWLLVATKLLTVKIHSLMLRGRSWKFGKVGLLPPTPKPWLMPSRNSSFRTTGNSRNTALSAKNSTLTRYMFVQFRHSTCKNECTIETTHTKWKKNWKTQHGPSRIFSAAICNSSLLFATKHQRDLVHPSIGSKPRCNKEHDMVTLRHGSMKKICITY